MVPDLTGLSQEEADLITDVLSRLSLGTLGTALPGSHAIQEDAGQQSENKDLLELDIAEQAIERELREMQACPEGNAVGVSCSRPGPTPRPSPHASQTPYAGRVLSPRSLLPSCATNTMASTADGMAGMSPRAGASPRQPSRTEAVLLGSRIPAQPGATAIASAPRPVGADQKPEETPSNATAVGVRPAGCPSADTPCSAEPSPRLTLTAAVTASLQGMRERLRQQQLLNAASAAAASVGDAAVPEPQVDQAATEAATAHISTTDKAGGSQASHGAGGNGGSTACSAASTARTAATFASTASPRPGRGTASAPSTASKAFSMLNARTSLDRYGGEPGLSDAKSTSPSRAPVRLPEKERSARLQQLYQRSLQWRKRCEEQHAKARKEREAMELEGCTFSPQVSPASNLIMQGKPPSEVYNDATKWGTPTKHRRDTAPAPQPRPQSACNTSSTQTPHRRLDTWTPSTASRAAASSGNSSSTAQASHGSHVRAAAAAAAAASASAAECSSVNSNHVSSPSASDKPGKVVVDGAKVGSRLYNRALERRFRHEERVVQQLLEEERQRHFTASVQGITPRVYDPPQQSAAARHLPTGMEECTFHPRTRFRAMSVRAADDSALYQRFDGHLHHSHVHPHFTSPSSNHHHHHLHHHRDSKHHDAPPTAAVPASLRSSSTGSAARPKSAPHLRGEHGCLSPGGSQPPCPSEQGPAASPRSNTRADGGANHASSMHTTISISPDLNWEEFLDRQGRFLAIREEKLQSLEQSVHSSPAGPRMSPGSKKLLQERGLRESSNSQVVGQEGVGGGMHGEASTFTSYSSPTWHDRRVRTIMEMYKECTFQPQITRKAAALPGRNVEELADGGRSRREEWIAQQRALQQVREVEGATFKPQLANKEAFSHVRPRINLRNPDAYLAHVAHKRRQRDALRAELESERAALELQHCTFKPQTTPLPPYLIRRLQGQQLQQQLQLEQQELQGLDNDPQLGPYMAWDQAEGYGGVGAVDIEGVEGYPAYYDEGLGVESPGQHLQAEELDYPYIEDEAFELPAHDMDEYINAYQRALYYATAQPHGT